MKHLVTLSLAFVFLPCILAVSTLAQMVDLSTDEAGLEQLAELGWRAANRPPQKAILDKDILEFNKDLGSSKATVKKSFLPRKEADADFYYINLRYKQLVNIDVGSNTVYLSKKNKCRMSFKVSDSKGKELSLNDSPAGISHWYDQIEDGRGTHEIKVYMGCLQAFTTDELRKKKPKFRYTLQILGSRAANR